MNLTYVSCFCIDNLLSSGNPAVVIEEFSGNDIDKQKLATKLNFPVTVFIEKIADQYLLRFFYPLREMSLCLHGSLSAAYVLMKQQDVTCFHALTKSNQNLLFKKLNDDVVQLEVDKGTVLPISFLKEDLNTMLGIKYQNVLNKNLPHCIATIGSPKLLIPLLTYDALTQVKPNFDFIKHWSINNNINGLYVYTDDTHDDKVNFIARGFNPKGGAHEDAATGVAVGALYTALKNAKEIRVRQGEFIKKPSYIFASSIQDKILIGGEIRVDIEKHTF
jgi:trans-2,3-dihydro-3-hydroxyanthranilate isomerase